MGPLYKKILYHKVKIKILAEQKMGFLLCPKELYLTNFLILNIFWAPKNRGARGCSLPCLCVKTALNAQMSIYCIVKTNLAIIFQALCLHTTFSLKAGEGRGRGWLYKANPSNIDQNKTLLQPIGYDFH